MKILLTVDPEIPVPPVKYGGIERIVDMLVIQYVKKGHDVTLCANRESKVPCRLISWKGEKSQVFSDIIKNAALLTRVIYQNKFDVVHSFSRLAYMAAIFPFAIPKVMSYQREPSLKQVRKAALLAKKNSLVFTGCSNYISSQVATITEAHTIYNCAPIAQYQATQSVEEDAPLMFLGRIEPVKGAHIAVQIAVTLKKKLIIAGNIPEGYEVFFEKNIRPFLSDRIIYTGPVNDVQKNTFLGQSLALLMPICWNEPFGIVMAEAMACGTPVLGFRRGSVPEVIEEGVSGFISDSIDEMMNHVSECARLNRRAIRKIAEEKFSDEKISNDYIRLYQDMISRRIKA